MEMNFLEFPISRFELKNRPRHCRATRLTISRLVRGMAREVLATATRPAPTTDVVSTAIGKIAEAALWEDLSFPGIRWLISARRSSPAIGTVAMPASLYNIRSSDTVKSIRAKRISFVLFVAYILQERIIWRVICEDTARAAMPSMGSERF